MPENGTGMAEPEDLAQELGTIHKICSAHMTSLQNKSKTQVTNSFIPGIPTLQIRLYFLSSATLISADK